MESLSAQQLAQYIDHTLLKPEADLSDLATLCEQAIEYGFKTVCVKPEHVAQASKMLVNSEVLPITVVGFPSGLETTQEKVRQTQQAIEKGAREIDMVLNYPKLYQKDYAYVLEDIKAVSQACGTGIPLKVILECSELSASQIAVACAVSKLAGAQFVKTSTGFSKSGARVEDVELMRQVVGDKMGVKASGGIRDLKTVLKMIEAGASRLGMSSSVEVIEELQRQSGNA